MNPTKCCQTCISDERFVYTVPSCSEGEDEAYFNNGLDCNLHLFADDETLHYRFSLRNGHTLDCAKCKSCVIHGGRCYERKVACMGFVEVKE